MKRMLNRLLREEDGQDLIEYALLMGLIAIICIAAITAGGTAISAVWSRVEAELNTVAS